MSRWTPLALELARAVLLAGALAGAAARAAVPAALPAAAEVRVEALLLAVRLNGIDRDEMVRALRTPQGLALAEEDWNALQFATPAEEPLRVEGSRYRRLEALPGLHSQVDELTQTLVLEAPASCFAGATLGLGSAVRAPSSALAWGGYANYDAQWQHNRSADVAQGLVEFGGFGPAGTGRVSGLLRTGTPLPSWTRLDTSWTYDRPAQRDSLRIGDAISQPGAWGQAARYGGVQWATDFSTQPGFLSFPLPALRGEAVLPSTVDVYVNNSRRVESQVPAGAFELNEVPIVTGSGQVRVVVRDLLGREQVIVSPYYVSPALLKPGLHAYAFELGALREDYGLESNRYGKLVASATDRLGVTDRFTRELRAEALGRRVALGATGLWLVPAVGTLSLGAVASRSEAGRPGAMALAAVDRQDTQWSASAQLRAASRDYTQLGQGNAPAPRLQGTLALGANLGATSLGLGLVAQQGRGPVAHAGEPGSQAVGSPAGASQRLLTLNASRPLGTRASLGVFALRDLAQRGGTTVALTLNLLLDADRSIGATALRHRGGSEASLNLQRNPSDDAGYGYQLSADRGTLQRDTAQGVLRTRYGELQGGIAQSRSGTDARAGASGSLAWVGDSVFAGPRIDGSFAVVDVGGYPDVQVLRDHRVVARTDARGRALVTGLRGYQSNRIGADAADLPFDAQVDALEIDVVPPARSGVVVRIPVSRTRAATFRLVDRDGQPLPAGSVLHVAGQTESYPIGYDGRGFVSGLDARSVLRARGPAGVCSAVLELEPGDDDLPDLGTLSCR